MNLARPIPNRRPTRIAAWAAAALVGLAGLTGSSSVFAQETAAKQGQAPAQPPAQIQQLPDDPIDPSTIPAAILGLQYENHLGDRIPKDLQFTDSEGRRVELGTYFNTPGRPVLMLLVYFRCPSICPGMIARVQQRLNDLEIAAGDKLNFVVVSFDPTDTPARAAEMRKASLDAYKHKDVVEADAAGNPAASGGWAFLTDSGGNGLKLAKALGFPVRYQPAAKEYAHGSDIFILAPDGTLCRYLGFDPPAQTLRLSLVEASQGKIATTLDRVLLWCFHFDPNSNSYVIQAWRFMQVSAVITLSCLTGLLAWMYRIERRRRAPSSSPRSVLPFTLPVGAPAPARS